MAARFRAAQVFRNQNAFATMPVQPPKQCLASIELWRNESSYEGAEDDSGITEGLWVGHEL